MIETFRTEVRSAYQWLVLAALAGGGTVRSAEAASRAVCAELRLRRLMARAPRRRTIPAGTQ